MNNLLIGKTITTNSKLIAKHINAFFTSVAVTFIEKIVKAKTCFYIILVRLLMKLSFFLQ